MSWMDRMDEEQARVKDQLEYDRLVEEQPLNKELIDDIVKLITELNLDNPRKTITLGGWKKYYGEVQKRFKVLTKDHVDYVLECMDRSGSKIRNIRNYLITALMNAPSTMHTHYVRLAAANERRRTTAGEETANMAGTHRPATTKNYENPWDDEEYQS